MGTMKNFKLLHEFPENFVWMDWFKSNIGSPRKTLNSVCFLQNLFRGQVIQTTARKTTWKSYEHLRHHSCVLSRNLAENLVILLCNTWRESLAVKQCIVYLDVDKFTVGFYANSVKLLTLFIVSFEWNIWLLRLFKKLNKNWQAWNNNKIFEIKIVIICVRSYHWEELKKISIEVFIFQGNFQQF